jgi:NAD(P)-dependent dehydrogenase (short-subunit alcohol dehydrogenase family)
MPNVFDRPFQALVIGASGAIGQAFTQALSQTPNCTRVVAVSRATHPDFDLRDEASLATLAQTLAASAPYGLIVDATGALTINGRGPEKSLAALDMTQLADAMQINAIAPALLLKYLSPLLPNGHAIYAKLSARVGSISDNRKGGWYGYRASKAALNMLLQTAALELQRKNPQIQVVALQPGTVQSKLSAPFTAGAPNILSAEQSVSGLLAALAALASLRPQSGAHFLDYQGKSISW